MSDFINAIAKLAKERDQLRAELEQMKSDMVDLSAIRDLAMAHLKAAERREAAMREALIIARKNLHWDAKDNDAVLIPIRDALSMTAGSDLLTKEQVRPLVEALEKQK